jgi:hypothetical protein
MGTGTAELSFTIRYLRAHGGLNISASHNPPDDNGGKFYDEHGGQPVPPDDQIMADLVDQVAHIKAGTTAGPEVTKITPPEREYDGRRCHVHFVPVAGAKTYAVWVSPYADGRGAILLGKDWGAPGQLLTGLSPNIDLYLFVVAQDAAGNASKPGKPLKVNLKDMFPMK